MTAKFPPEHYPQSGVQHTRAVVALTLATLCFEIYTPLTSSEFDDHIRKIKGRIKDCSTLTKKKKLSAGAKRDMDNCSIIWTEYVKDWEKRSGEARYRRWGELVYCALTFIEDVLYTCPQYVFGLEEKRWQRLQKDMSDLAEALMQGAPIDEGGTYIYERCAWALEGVNFQMPEREPVWA